MFFHQATLNPIKKTRWFFCIRPEDHALGLYDSKKGEVAGGCFVAGLTAASGGVLLGNRCVGPGRPCRPRELLKKRNFKSFVLNLKKSVFRPKKAFFPGAV